MHRWEKKGEQRFMWEGKTNAGLNSTKEWKGVVFWLGTGYKRRKGWCDSRKEKLLSESGCLRLLKPHVQHSFDCSHSDKKGLLTFPLPSFLTHSEVAYESMRTTCFIYKNTQLKMRADTTQVALVQLPLVRFTGKWRLWPRGVSQI